MNKRKTIFISLATSAALPLLLLLWQSTPQEEIPSPVAESRLTESGGSSLKGQDTTHSPAVDSDADDEELQAIDKNLEAEADMYLANLEGELEQLDGEVEEQYSSIWEISGTSPMETSLELNEKIKTYEPINIDKENAANVAVGEIVTLSLPGAEEYLVVVAAVNINTNGETSWSGYLAEYADDYPVTFTLGEYASFATVATPEGLYSMETVGNSGWVYKTPDMSDLVDPNQPDHLIADQHTLGTISN